MPFPRLLTRGLDGRVTSQGKQTEAERRRGAVGCRASCLGRCGLPGGVRATGRGWSARWVRGEDREQALQRRAASSRRSPAPYGTSECYRPMASSSPGAPDVTHLWELMSLFTSLQSFHLNPLNDILPSQFDTSGLCVVKATVCPSNSALCSHTWGRILLGSIFYERLKG